MKRFTTPLLLIALLTTACSGTGPPTPTTAPVAQPAPRPGIVVAEGRLRPATSIELAFAQGGVVADVLVEPGAEVAAGDSLARLIGREAVEAERAAAVLEQTLAQQAVDELARQALLGTARTESALNAAEQAYDRGVAGWRLGSTADASDLELALDDFITAERDYREARDTLDDLLEREQSNRERREAQVDFDRERASLADRYADLLDDVAAHEQVLEPRLIDLLDVIATLQVARDRHDRLTGHLVDPELQAAAEARLDAARAHGLAAEATLALYELRAPFAGTVLAVDLEAGDVTGPGHPVLYLADPDRWIVETKDLAEIDIARVRLGQTADLVFDGLPGDTFSAQVSAINPVGRLYLGDMTYQVTLALDAPDPRLMWNMTAIATIAVGE